MLTVFLLPDPDAVFGPIDAARRFLLISIQRLALWFWSASERARAPKGVNLDEESVECQPTSRDKTAVSVIMTLILGTEGIKIKELVADKMEIDDAGLAHWLSQRRRVDCACKGRPQRQIDQSVQFIVSLIAGRLDFSFQRGALVNACRLSFTTRSLIEGGFIKYIFKRMTKRSKAD
jgi:hypothetical protein